jgi:hypothetical protein
MVFFVLMSESETVLENVRLERQPLGEVSPRSKPRRGCGDGGQLEIPQAERDFSERL